MFSQVIGNDWKNLTADITVWLVAIGFALLIAYAIYNGAMWTRTQNQLSQKTIVEQETELIDNKARLARGETTPEAEKSDPSDAYAVGGGLTYSVLPSLPLAFTSIGQSDLLRPRIGVSVVSKQRTEADKQGFENPLSFLAGRFDLAFVIVYLLPLLILALSFNLLSSERENGTLQMVLSQPISLAGFALTKFFYRAALVSVFVCGVAVLGVFVSGVSWRSDEFWGRLVLWLVAVPVYALFWFVLALLVNSFGRSSATNAIVLAGCWIALVLVVPSLVNVALTTIYPMPSRIDEVNAIRSVNLDMRRDGSRLVSEFYQDHPELAPQSDASEKALTLAFITIQQELKRRLNAVEEKFNVQLERQQSIVNQARFASPAIGMQEILNQIAATDTQRYQLFRAQAKGFAESWDATFLPSIYRNVKLTTADYDRIPRFNFREQGLFALWQRTLIGILGILAPTALMLGFSVQRLRKALLLDSARRVWPRINADVRGSEQVQFKRSL